MSNGNNVKPNGKIGKFMASMSPEEYAEMRRVNGIKHSETLKKKHQAKKDEAERMRKDAYDLAVQGLVEDFRFIENENYVPKPEVLAKVRALLDQPSMTFDALKRKHFAAMSEKGWNKLTKYLFQNQVSSVEDLGNDILQEKRRAVAELKKRVRMLRKEVKMSREMNFEKHKKKFASPKLLEMLGEAEKEYREFVLDVQRTLNDVKFSNEKKSGALSLHVHTSVPRPQPKDVTPPKVNLSEVLNGD